MSNKKHAEEAADALSDLTMLYAIIYLTENSLFRSASARKSADRIHAICKHAAQIQLEKYDRHLGRIKP